MLTDLKTKGHPLAIATMIHQIIDQYDVNTDQVLMVGDSIHDLQMAKNAGINAVAVTCGAHSVSILEPYNPLACSIRTTDLIVFLRGNE